MSQSFEEFLAQNKANHEGAHHDERAEVRDKLGVLKAVRSFFWSD